MLHSMKDIRDFQIAATDGTLGVVDEFLFDERDWTIRYLVAKTGGWATGRKMLISPQAIEEIDWEQESVLINLAQQQVRQIPAVDAGKPASRQHEAEFARHYGYLSSWNQPYLWGESALPDLPANPDLDDRSEEVRYQDAQQDSPHLRSSREVETYAIRTTDNTIGHIEDFLFEDRGWSIPMVVAETREWWPGKHVLIATSRIDYIDWEDRCIAVRVTREELEHNPDYDLMSAHPEGAVQDLYRRFWRSPYSP